MSGLLAVLLLAGGGATIETFGLATVDSNPALRVIWSGTVGKVDVVRVGEEARVSLEGAGLGALFAGATRFELHWSSLQSDATRAISAPVEGIRIENVGSGVRLSMRLPAGVALDVRRGQQGVALVFSKAPKAPSPVLQAAAQPARAPKPASRVPTPAPAPEATPAPPVRMAALSPANRTPLFPVPAAESTPNQAEPAASVVPMAVAREMGDLQRKLFPNAPVESGQDKAAAAASTPRASEAESGWSLGFFRLRPSLSVSYVDADVAIGGPQPVHDNYVQVQPGLAVDSKLLDGRLSLEYRPALRALGSFEAVQSSSHLVGAGLDLPLGQRLTLRASDRFATGVLETTEVDPGQEYFFDLGRFYRNATDVRARILFGPRLGADLAAGMNRVWFNEPSGFFGFESRQLAAGFGFELTPTLRAAVTYGYDWVPQPEDRPLVESQAHSVQASLDGDVLPELKGTLSIGYRDHRSPGAAAGGRRFRGLVLSGNLARSLGRSGALGIYLNRSTQLSAFEENAFYMSNSARVSLTLPLPYAFSLDSGGSFLMNDYRTPAVELGRPRKDRVYGWFLGLRRPITRWASLSAIYRRDDRNSNLSEFDSTVDGLVLRLDLNLFPERR